MWRWMRNIATVLKKPRGAGFIDNNDYSDSTPDVISKSISHSKLGTLKNAASYISTNSVLSSSSFDSIETDTQSLRTMDVTSSTISLTASTARAFGGSSYEDISEDARSLEISLTNKTSINDENGMIIEYEKEFATRKVLNDSKKWNETFPPDSIVIYTSAMFDNIYKQSSIGIYIGPRNELNKSCRIRRNVVDLNEAEMIAIKVALINVINSGKHNDKRIIVRTSSLNSIKWIRQGNGDFPELCKSIQNLKEKFAKGIEYQLVHIYDDDPGIMIADCLSQNGLYGNKGLCRRRSRSLDCLKNNDGPRQIRSQSNRPFLHKRVTC